MSEAIVPEPANLKQIVFPINSLVKLGFTPTKKLSLDFFANYDRLKMILTILIISIILIRL
jgi:vitamin B12 transporter